MGVDFNALVGHDLDLSELHSLTAQLNLVWRLPTELQPWVAEHVKVSPQTWSWRPYEDSSTVEQDLSKFGHVFLNGPDGFHAFVYKHAIDVSHLCRWWSFLHEGHLQDGLRSAMRLFGSTVGAQSVLYTPDSSYAPSSASNLVMEGASFATALAHLRSTIGPPLPFAHQFNPDSDTIYDRAWFYEEIAG